MPTFTHTIIHIHTFKFTHSHSHIHRTHSHSHIYHTHSHSHIRSTTLSFCYEYKIIIFTVNDWTNVCGENVKRCFLSIILKIFAKPSSQRSGHRSLCACMSVCVCCECVCCMYVLYVCTVCECVSEGCMCVCALPSTLKCEYEW